MADAPPTFTIEQTGNNPTKVTLDDHDLPFGQPREKEAFELGGENARKMIYLTGRSGAIIHTEQTQYAPVVIEGHLRDEFYAEDGRAQEKVRDLCKILGDKRLCTLKYGPWEWTAFPHIFKLPVESLNDFTYKLTWDILTAPNFPQQAKKKKTEAMPVDVASQFRALLAADRANLLAQYIALNVMLGLQSGYDSMDRALDIVQQAAQAFQNAPAKATAQARLMSSKAQEAKARADELQAMIDNLNVNTTLTKTTGDVVASFQAVQYSSSLNIGATKTAMRSLQFTANQRIAATTKIYQVGPGDTPESIAAAKLGSAARAGELNYRQQDLKVGRLISIPA